MSKPIRSWPHRSDMAARGASAAKRMTGIPLTPHSGPLDDGATCGVHHSFARELVQDSRASPQQCCLGMECSDPVPCPRTAAFATIEPPFESLLTFLNMEDGNEGL